MNQLGILRSIADAELELMREWRNAPAVRANMYSQQEISREEHLSWWERIKSSADQKYFMYEIGGTPLGITAFNRINIHSRNSDWAFYASPTAPKGTGSNMEYLMLEYAFNTLKLHKLYGEVLAFNTRVISLHQKFGFKVEGVLREQRKINDQFVDICMVGIIAAEWQEKRQAMYEKLIAKTRVLK